MKKYFATCFGEPTIEEIECVSETAKTITLVGEGLGLRQNKETTLGVYVDTYSEAQTYLIKTTYASLERQKHAYEASKARYEAALKLGEVSHD
jgi:hypothetical protein